MTLPINACSSLSNLAKCCLTFFIVALWRINASLYCVIIGSFNGLSPAEWQVFTWIKTTRMYFKMSFACKTYSLTPGQGPSTHYHTSFRGRYEISVWEYFVKMVKCLFISNIHIYFGINWIVSVQTGCVSATETWYDKKPKRSIIAPQILSFNLQSTRLIYFGCIYVMKTPGHGHMYCTIGSLCGESTGYKGPVMQRSYEMLVASLDIPWSNSLIAGEIRRFNASSA